MTATSLHHGRSVFASAPGPSTELLELSSTPDKLVVGVLEELARIHSNRPTVVRVDLRLREGLLLVETVDPLQRRVVWAGTGAELDAWFPSGFGSILGFAPGYVDLLHLGETRMTGDVREPIVYQAMQGQPWEIRSRLPERILHSSMRIEDAWWGQIELVRASTVVGEYYRRSAAALLRQRLSAVSDDHEKHLSTIRSCLRFCFPNSFKWGRTFVPVFDDEPGVANLVYSVQTKSRLRQGLYAIGREDESLRFEVTPREQPTPDEAKKFARSLKRHGIAKIGVVVSRRPPLWDFDALASDLRSSANYAPLILLLTHGQLRDLIDNAEQQGFAENERWLIERLGTAYRQANRVYKYDIECADRSSHKCRGSIPNELVFGGLRRAQLCDLAAGQGIELDREQIRRNWHVLSLADRAAAQRGDPVYLEAELDTVCAGCGTDQDTDD